jgi:hypothetical protein
MFSFFKKKEPKVVVPEWANFFNLNEYEAFMAGIDAYFRNKNIEFEHHDGTLKLIEGAFGYANMGLLNLAQNCKQFQISEYPDKIAYHFDMMERIQSFQKEFSERSSDFDYAKEYIGVRLHHEDYIKSTGVGLTLTKPVAGNIQAMLIFDLPDSTINIQPKELVAWGKSFDELYQLGIDNMKTKYPKNPQLTDFGEMQLWFDSADHFFTSNIVFELEEKRYLIGTYGSIIALPHRHSVLIYPIESQEVIPALTQLIPAVYGMHNEGPGSLSEQLFWYKNGDFTVLPYSVEDSKLNFYPPEDFVNMLNSLVTKP